ncbi:MAG: tetratricopeptide repeat protein [Deltaproteobacteria bacterium]|nr:tetratricopeptide repeat protein [Deltaproteobacteria bacterium]
MALILQLLLLLFVCGFIAWPLLRRRQRALPAGLDAELDERLTQKESLLTAIKELEFDLKAGKLAQADYDELRQDCEARAVALLAEIDQLEARVQKARKAAGPSPAGAPAGMAILRSAYLIPGAVVVLALGFGGGYLYSRQGRGGDQGTGAGQQGGASLAALEQQAEARPDDIPTLLSLGRAYLEAERLPKAIESFKRVLDLDPQNAEALTSMGVILIGAGHAEMALSLFDRVLGMNPKDPQALWAKGLALFQGKRDYAGAIKVWEEVIAVAPTSSEGRAVQGLIEEARRRQAAGEGPAGTTGPGGMKPGTGAADNAAPRGPGSGAPATGAPGR